jgi:hypothetical protein
MSALPSVSTIFNIVSNNNHGNENENENKNESGSVNSNLTTSKSFSSSICIHRYTTATLLSLKENDLKIPRRARRALFGLNLWKGKWSRTQTTKFLGKTKSSRPHRDLILEPVCLRSYALSTAPLGLIGKISHV